MVLLIYISIIQYCTLLIFFCFQRAGSVRGEDVPYVLGLPLVLGEPFFPHNYSSEDSIVSKKLIHYLSNFIRRG